MTQWVETLAAKSENPNSICRTHTVGDLSLTSYPLTSTHSLQLMCVVARAYGSSVPRKQFDSWS